MARRAEGHQGRCSPFSTARATTIRHFWGSELFYAPTEPGQEPRHVGTLEPLWNLFDLTPEGRPSGWDEPAELLLSRYLVKRRERLLQPATEVGLAEGRIEDPVSETHGSIPNSTSTKRCRPVPPSGASVHKSPWSCTASGSHGDRRGARRSSKSRCSRLPCSRVFEHAWRLVFTLLFEILLVPGTVSASAANRVAEDCAITAGSGRPRPRSWRPRQGLRRPQHPRSADR